MLSVPFGKLEIVRTLLTMRPIISLQFGCKLAVEPLITPAVTLPHGSAEARCGGRTLSEKSPATPRKKELHTLHDLVKPAFVSTTLKAPRATDRLRTLLELDRLGQEAVMSKLADATRKAYSSGWRHWELFMSGTGQPPFLTGETRPEKLADEAWLIRFVDFLHEVMGRTAQGSFRASGPFAREGAIVG